MLASGGVFSFGATTRSTGSASIQHIVKKAAARLFRVYVTRPRCSSLLRAPH